jgi:uncharacterized protein (TIGR03083 family)
MYYPAEMSLASLAPTDTRALFRPLAAELTAVLRSLSPSDWERQTIAGSWLVRDVVAHIVDLSCRRLSFHRDRMPPPPPSRTIASERDFVEFINDLNADWVRAGKRLSPRVLADLAERAGAELADWFESVPIDAPALFGVSWAGEQTSAGWFDIGREYAELWHHQQQVRLAVGAPLLADRRFLRPVLEIAVRALPHAFRDQRAAAGQTVACIVTGDAGGSWTLVREDDGWRLMAGVPTSPTTRVELSDDAAWRLFFHAVTPADVERAIVVSGRRELAQPLLRARAVIV